MPFLPIEKQDVDFDIILITPEAYVDHPSFGHAIVGRLLQYYGLNVGILAQPQSDYDYKKLGTPKMGFMISGGVVDSMVNNYTVAKMRRTTDVYSEGGVFGLRPDRCVSVYSRKIKQLFSKDMPVIVGGIEPSLRRFAHYDYWSDSVMPSILVDSGADLLIYGMGERPIKEICELLKKGVPMDKIKDIRGTCYLDSFANFSVKLKEKIAENEVVYCAPFEEVKNNKLSYVKAFNVQSANSDYISAKIVLQKHGDKYLVQNQPQIPLSEKELDLTYDLPYMRTYHPIYKKGVPAIEEVKFSITSHRGCFGGCNYCALTYHQGRVIQKRSKESIIEEATAFTKEEDFKGYIHDVGGPTANFRNKSCKSQSKNGVCTKKQCIGFEPCQNLEVSHSEYLDILKTLREIEGVKKVFIRSGIRFDYVMLDNDTEFFKELVKHHISGQLKVAPEHCVDEVLKAMNKPTFKTYLDFKDKYDELNTKLGKNQFLVPYLISSHPGCTLADAVRLAEYLKSINYMPEQVQDFYPTPSTKSTCMYFTGINPDTMEEVYVPREKSEKKLQRALLQYRKKENYTYVLDALKQTGRVDLIGFSANCLIKPTKNDGNYVKINGQTKTKGKERAAAIEKGEKPKLGIKISETERRKMVLENKNKVEEPKKIDKKPTKSKFSHNNKRR